MKLHRQWHLWGFAMFVSSAGLLTNLSLRAQALSNLGDLGGGSSQALGINDSGRVVGFAYAIDGNPYAFISSNGTMTQLSTSPSEATSINNSGVVAGLQGFGDPETGYTHAVTFTNGTVQDLGALGNGNSFAYGINNSGTVVGFSVVNGNPHAFVYTNGTMSDLGTLGGTLSYAAGINSSGQITGNAETSAGYGYDHAFLTSNGTMTDLNPAVYESMGLGVNDNGDVVGKVTSSGGYFHAFLYTNGSMLDLGTLGGNSSVANSINNRGWIVGESNTSTGGNSVYDATFYSSQTGLEDLNLVYASLLVTESGSQTGFTSLTDATAINNLGEVVGYGNYWNGTSNQTEAFLLDSVVPEPASWILILGGFAVLMILQINRKRSQKN